MSERRTRQLEAIYRALLGARDHPSAEQLHARVKQKMVGVSLGTVYRNLNKLATQGRIRRLQHAGTRPTRFEAVLEPHTHFFCELCGSIADLPRLAPRDVDAAPLSRAGFKVRGHTLTYFGACPSCRANAKQGQQRRDGSSKRPQAPRLACSESPAM